MLVHFYGIKFEKNPPFPAGRAEGIAGAYAPVLFWKKSHQGRRVQF